MPLLTLTPDAATRRAVNPAVAGTQEPRLRVVVADDHPVIRARLSTLLNAEPDLAVVGTGWNGMEAIRLVHQLGPDVLVADQDMDDLGGMEVAAHLGVAGIEIRVVLYTTNDAEEQLVGDRETADCALDEESIDSLVTAIRRRQMPQLASGVTSP